MKHFTWAGALAVVAIAGVIYWTNREPDLAGKVVIEPQVAEVRPVDAVSSPRNAVASVDVNEPILVLPEFEVAPVPQPVGFDEEPKRVGQVYVIGSYAYQRPPTERIGPRPEAGRDTRPWMPYASEDEELSATRRLAWAKLLTQDPAIAEAAFEETAEPPLFEPKKR